MEKRIDTINSVRAFSCFYTNILGLTDQYILDSCYSLTEARILFELNELGRCMANTLSARLNIDKSYMSRILAKFEKKGLISKKVSRDDKRAAFIELTKEGAADIGGLIEKSNSQIDRLLAPLSDSQCDEIRAAMDAIMKRLTRADAAITVRPFTADDTDFVISHQIKLYENEYGFTSEVWKAYVTNGVQQLVKQFDKQKDCIYILDYNGRPAGCVAIARIGADTAQLRFFFVEAALRGLGAGQKLIDLAIDFCKEKQYKQVFLWTFSALEAARHLYAKKGFALKTTRENSEWGSLVTEERWDLRL